MPAQPLWFDRLESIIGELRGMEGVVPYLDRGAVERLFGVGERRARQLMSGLAGVRVGNAVAVERGALLERCLGVLKGDAFRVESVRRARVAASVDAARKAYAGRRVRVRDVGVGAKGLPEGVSIGNGEMRIRYGSAVELAEKLFRVSQMMSEDWEAFEGVLT